MLIHSIQSEWLKTRKSLSSWLVIIGGFFVPAIYLYDRLTHFSGLAEANQSMAVWDSYFRRCWQYMSILLLPVGIILTVSLITQLEYRNNTWKQVHTTPQSLTTIFAAKWIVIMTMLLQCFMLFNLGIWLVVAIPALFPSVPFPAAEIQWAKCLEWNHRFFVASLPIVGFQYLISLLFRNFMIPLGVGMGLFIASLIGMSWKYCYLIPYTYLSSFFMNNTDNLMDKGINIYWCAVGYFALFMVLSYIVYLVKKPA
jgi:lantibiotic transport system permease protein